MPETFKDSDVPILGPQDDEEVGLPPVDTNAKPVLGIGDKLNMLGSACQIIQDVNMKRDLEKKLHDYTLWLVSDAEATEETE